jgi:hypothetical protein
MFRCLRPVLVLCVLASALTAGAAPPAAAQPVKLRWKVPKEAPLGYELVWQSVTTDKNTVRIDLSTLKDARKAAEQRKAILDIRMPAQSVMAMVLSARGSDTLAAKVVVTRVEQNKKAPRTKLDRELAQQFQKMVGTVQIRASLTDWGLVTSELKREQRNLVSLATELPAKAVAVGDTWTHNADLVKMGESFTGTSESINRMELVGLEREGEGRTVALIDYTLAEKHDGKFVNSRTKESLPASMEMSFLGRGEFLVEEGRWRKLSGRYTTRATGAMKTDTAQQFTLTPLEPIPPKVLAAE